jgi:hypothetical protein
VITVRASTLESYRLYIDPDCNFVSTEEMEERLLDQADEERVEDLSDPRDVGTAFHETVAGTYVGAAIFEQETIDAARRGLDGALAEIEGSVVLDVGGVLVRVTGHADWLRGLDLWDFKTSAKPIAPDNHVDSMQWRCYCLIFGVERVTYRLVHLDEGRDGFYAKAIDDVVMYPYPQMHEDVVRCLHALLAFATLRGCLDAMDVDDSEAA